MSKFEFKDVFISYGRAESKHFATQLHDRLVAQGYKVWFDQNDIPLGVDFQDQIDEGIERAHNFIFIIAPHAVKSPYCRKEIELALKRGKRIIPILQIEPTEKEVWDMLHPAIGKINWIYMREQWQKELTQDQYAQLDDFDKGFEGLLSLLRQHEEYVKRHTELLVRALEWQRNHHSSTHLLVANERKQAEEWLFHRFDDVQAPCHPSDLHCQYISEAKKNANNLQTDVFIASADGNVPIRDSVIFMLARYGITSWTHTRDIESGEDFHTAIRKGIEGADNLLFLITKDSLQSEYCIQELEYAIELNKRIIPIRLETIDDAHLPKPLQNIQYIDFTDNQDDKLLSRNEKTDFEKDIDEILTILQADMEYFQRHKVLLVQALKWQRQDRNASMLLRGHNLDQAKAWLKLGQKRSALQPLPIHEEFIAESQAKNTSLRTDVFVSYSRTDGDFARKLNDGLQIAGKTTWFDQESIASGADFQTEIYKGIENADNIVFILSPDSILSPYCADEVEHARKLGKRFITILYREIDTTQLPPTLAAVQWIDFRPNHIRFEKQFAELIRTLDTDREHVRAHTKWQQRAMEWESFDKPSDLLLRGNELILAYDWRKTADNEAKIPVVTALQHEFIKNSRQEERKRLRNVEQNKHIAIAALAVILAIAILAGSQWYKSWQHQQELATQNLLFESKSLVEDNPNKALQLAYEAYRVEEYKTLPTIHNLYEQLESTIDKLFYVELKAQDTILRIISNKEKNRYISIDINQDAILHGANGEIITIFDKPIWEKIAREDYNFNVPTAVNLSDDGKYAILHFRDGTVGLFNDNGQLIKELFQADTALYLMAGFAKLADTTCIVVGETYNFSGTSRIFDTKGNEVDKSQIQLDHKNYKSLFDFITNAVYPQFAELSIGSKSSRTDILDSKIAYYLGFDFNIVQEDEQIWHLYRGTSQQLIAKYKFDQPLLFTTNKTQDFLLMYQGNHVIGFEFPPLLKESFDAISPISAKEKIHYETASLDDYREVPFEIAMMLSKAIMFGVVFLLSILIFNYFNKLYLDHRYFKIIIYLLTGISVALVWTGLLLNDSHVIRLSFFSALSVAVAGFYYGYQSFKQQLYFNTFLYGFSAFLLVMISLFVAYYVIKDKGFALGIQDLFGLVNFLMLLFVAIIWITSERASIQFSQRNFRFFSDWIGLQIFTIGAFATLALFPMTGSVSEISLQEAFKGDSFVNYLALLVLLILPITYFLRTFIHNLVMFKYEKAPYSKAVLRMYAGIVIVLVLIVTLTILLPDIFGSISLLLIFLFIPFYYFFTLFVAYKQKDMLNLRLNFASWWGFLIFFILLGIVSDLNGSKNLTAVDKMTYVFIAFLVWIVPVAGVGWFIIWRKKRKQHLQLN